MQAHRSDLPATAILNPGPVPRVGTVQALGLSDALCVELRNCQLADFVNELDELQGPLSETYECARRHWLELSRGETSPPPPEASAAEEKLWTAAYAIRVLAAIRFQVPQTPGDERTVVVGPATVVSSIIEGATRHAADELGELLRESPKLGVELQTAIRHRAAALQAWVETYVDCQAVGWYLFDPNWDPVTVVT